MDLITILAISHGIQYLYKFVKICGVYYSTVEIANKITVKAVFKHIDNASTAYDVGTFILATNKPSYNKKQRVKKKYISISSNNNMKKLYRSLIDAHHYYKIKWLEREEKRQEHNKNMLYEERKKRERKKDELNEIELFEYGFLRDETSRHYISPDKLLTDIFNAVLKNMNDPKWTNEDKNKLKNLICGSCESLYEFNKYDELFYFVDLMDRVTKRPFKCALLGDLVYSVKNIKMLQDKRDALTSRDVEDIEAKNKCVV